MKQAILVTAYKNFEHLEKIINFFNDNFEVYIHIDKKSTISEQEMLNLSKCINTKFISQKYNVNWGGLNHLKSILYLSEKALENKELCYFHLISGHDFPIKNSVSFFKFFNNNKREFINAFEVPSAGWGSNGGLERLEYYQPYDLLNWKNNFQRKIIKKVVKFQVDQNFKRGFPSKTPQIYGGSTWWSLSRNCLKYVVNFTKTNKYLLKRFKHTFCSEEFYFQTVIMNSEFSHSVENNNHRYIDWSNRNGNNPSVLDETDYDKILKSKSFFARRFDYPISEKLLNNIIESLNES